MDREDEVSKTYLYCVYDASNVFRSHYAGEILKTQQSPVILNLCLRKTQAGKSHRHRDVIALDKFCFQNVFRPHENVHKLQPVFPNSSGLNTVFVTD